MSRSKLYQVEALVLGRREQGEADRVLLLLTPQGRLDALARGVRKLRSRKAGHLELFCRSQLLIARVENSWDIVSQAETLDAHAGLRDDFVRGTYARHVAELTLRFFEGETEPALYTLLDETLTRLERAADPERAMRWYEQRVLDFAGFRPEWRQCVGERAEGVCEALLRPRAADRHPYGFDPERGGALCAECFAHHREARDVRPLSPSALSWLQAFQLRAYEDIIGLNWPPATARELAQIMEQYVAYHLERRPAALRVMKRADAPVSGNRQKEGNDD